MGNLAFETPGNNPSEVRSRHGTIGAQVSWSTWAKTLGEHESTALMIVTTTGVALYYKIYMEYVFEPGGTTVTTTYCTVNYYTRTRRTKKLRGTAG